MSKSLLGDKKTRQLLSASTLGNLAVGMYRIGVPAYIVAKDGSLRSIGIAALLLSVWWVLSIPIGALVDKLGPGIILRWVLPFRAGAMVLAAIAVLNSENWFLLLCLSAAIYGLTDVFLDNSLGAIPPRILEEAQYDKAYSVLHLTNRIPSTILGPALGVLGAVSFPLLTFATAGFISLLAWLQYRAFNSLGPVDPGSPGQSFIAQISDGLRELFKHAFLKAATITLLGVVIAEEFSSVLSMPLSKQVFASHWQTILAIGSVAAGVAAILGAGLGILLSQRIGVHFAMCVAAIAAWLCPLLLLAPSVPTLIAVPVISVLCEAIWVPLMQAEAMRRVDHKYLARVRSGMMFVTWGSMPVAALAAAETASLLGVNRALLVAGLFAIICTLTGIVRFAIVEKNASNRISSKG